MGYAKARKLKIYIAIMISFVTSFCMDPKARNWQLGSGRRGRREPERKEVGRHGEPEVFTGQWNSETERDVGKERDALCSGRYVVCVHQGMGSGA